MAYIYKITNDINGKIYIGKTNRSIQERFKEHCKDCTRRNYEKRPLYAAMRKYGVEHFHIEQIEETTVPEEREKYWIEYYGSFKYGYNATIGGDGKPYIDYEIVIATYNELKNMNKTAKILGIGADTVSNILHAMHQKTLSSSEVVSHEYSKIINQYTLDGEYVASYPSCIEAARQLHRITNTSNGAASHISDVCRGKRKSAYGFIWKFAIIK